MARILQSDATNKDIAKDSPFHVQQTLVESEDGNIYMVSSSHSNPNNKYSLNAMYVNETMIFHANSDGQITDYHEVDAIHPRNHVEGIRLAMNGYYKHTTYQRIGD